MTNTVQWEVLMVAWGKIINSDRCSTGNGFKIVKVIAEINTAGTV